jgi:inward rectifier potassium channel
VGRFDFSDPYHLAVTLSWPQFILALLGTYLLVNFVFAVVYWLVPGAIANAHAGSLADAFFFSFETLATVGYGEMYPGSLYGHLVACAEIATGLGFTAIMTGLTFVRFSRPRAKFILAEHLVVCLHNGASTLMLRIGNGRLTSLADARAKLHILLRDVSTEGVTFRRVHELPLLRSHLPIFPLTWTLMHVVDEASPLFGHDAAALIAGEANLFVTLEARDPSLAVVVHELRTYGPHHVDFGVRYVDVISTLPDGTTMADMTLISETEPDVGPAQQLWGWSDREPDQSPDH